MKADLKTIRDEGYKALMQHLGAVGTVLFLRQFETGNGKGNYTEERRASLEDNNIDANAIVARIKESSES